MKCPRGGDCGLFFIEPNKLRSLSLGQGADRLTWRPWEGKLAPSERAGFLVQDLFLFFCPQQTILLDY